MEEKRLPSISPTQGIILVNIMQAYKGIYMAKDFEAQNVLKHEQTCSWAAE